MDFEDLNLKIYYLLPIRCLRFRNFLEIPCSFGLTDSDPESLAALRWFISARRRVLRPLTHIP